MNSMLEDKGINNISNSNIDVITNSSNSSIYSEYNSILIYIRDIEDNIKIKSKELSRLIKGPGDVKAQQYDNPISSMKCEDINCTYRDIANLNIEINRLESEKQGYLDKLDDIVKLCKDIHRKNKNDLMLTVFIEHHINKKTLAQLSKRLFHINSSGEKVTYHYTYLREINSNILKFFKQN